MRERLTGLIVGMEAANCLASKKHNVTVIGMEAAPLERVMGMILLSVNSRQLY